MAKFIVDGKEKELVYDFNGNGFDISNNVIGNTAHGMDIDEEGRYVATQEDFEWWEEYFENDAKLQAEIADAKEKYDSELVDEIINDAVGFCDMEDEFSRGMAALLELSQN